MKPLIPRLKTNHRLGRVVSVKHQQGSFNTPSRAVTHFEANHYHRILHQMETTSWDQCILPNSVFEVIPAFSKEQLWGLSHRDQAFETMVRKLQSTFNKSVNNQFRIFSPQIVKDARYLNKEDIENLVDLQIKSNTFDCITVPEMNPFGDRASIIQALQIAKKCLQLNAIDEANILPSIDLRTHDNLAFEDKLLFIKEQGYPGIHLVFQNVSRAKIKAVNRILGDHDIFIHASEVQKHSNDTRISHIHLYPGHGIDSLAVRRLFKIRKSSGPQMVESPTRFPGAIAQLKAQKGLPKGKRRFTPENLCYLTKEDYLNTQTSIPPCTCLGCQGRSTNDLFSKLKGSNLSDALSTHDIIASCNEFSIVQQRLLHGETYGDYIVSKKIPSTETKTINKIIPEAIHDPLNGF